MDIEYKSICMNELITNKILVINQWLTSNHIGSTQEKRYLIAKDIFWVIYENNKITGVGLTEVLVYKQHKSFHIILFAGIDFEKQSKVFPIVEAFAKDCGCSAVEQWGRKGWAKVLPKYVPGFKEVYTVMRKEL